MGFNAIVAVVAATCLASSMGARTGFLATMEVSEYANLRALIANTTKALKESQAATKLAAAPKAAAPKAAAPKAAEPKAAAAAAAPKAPATAAAAPHDHAATGAKGGLPQHVSKEREAMIVKQLSAEEDKLAKNLKEIKSFRKSDTNGHTKSLMKMMKGKDAEKLAGFDKFFDRMNAKSEVGCQDVLSKLKRIVHFVKKGGLSGNTKAADGLNGVLKEMTAMVGL